MEWWYVALIKILMINIVLSGDNAIIIAMASKNLPASKRKLAIFWGAFGAITLRVLLTLIAIKLLQIPYLTAIGALLLLWIAYKLVIQKDEKHDIQASDYLQGVIMTIILADFVMSLDNVLAITAIAKGDLIIITLGLVVSIPLIIWGSQILVGLMDKYPMILYLGAGILGFTAGEMLATDKIPFEALSFMYWSGFPVLLGCTLIFLGAVVNR